jgi:hypothetical protein
LVDKDYGAEESAVGENGVDIDAEDALAEKGETGVAEEGNGIPEVPSLDAASKYQYSQAV